MGARSWITLAAQATLAVGLVAAGALMLGPFQGAERAFGLSDKEAHALAFFALTLTACLAAPRLRKDDLALAALALAGASELAQGVVGREAGVGDLVADALGVFLAWAPMQAAQMRMRMNLRQRALDQGLPPPLSRRAGDPKPRARAAQTPPA